VMYAGRAAEYGSAEKLFNAPEHPYTWGLLGSMPRFDKPPTERLLPIKGTPPSLIKVPKGCAFNPRCDFQERVGSPCLHVRPDLLDNGSDHHVACHIPSAERRDIWAQEITPRLQ
ncbi:MAG: oligopeptide/dipeptide ABC transporter ATP-binding protein, partial [Marmoricola sp.]